MSVNNDTPAPDARQKKGAAIAQRGQVKKSPRGQWLVPSESSGTKYTVDMANGGWCSCPDHEIRGVKCKHIWSYTGQVNELLCKVLAHNICCLVHAIHELGIAPVFWTQDGGSGPR